RHAGVNIETAERLAQQITFDANVCDADVLQETCVTRENIKLVSDEDAGDRGFAGCDSLCFAIRDEDRLVVQRVEHGHAICRRCNRGRSSYSWSGSATDAAIEELDTSVMCHDDAVWSARDGLCEHIAGAQQKKRG